MRHYVFLLPSSTIKETIRTFLSLLCLIITNGYSSADSTGGVISIEPDRFHNFYLHPGTPPIYPTTRRLTTDWTATTTHQPNLDNQQQHYPSRIQHDQPQHDPSRIQHDQPQHHPSLVQQFEDYQQQHPQDETQQQQQQPQDQTHQQQQHPQDQTHQQQQQPQDQTHQQQQHQLFLLYHHLRTADTNIDQQPTIEGGSQPSDGTASSSFAQDLIEAQAQLSIPMMQTFTDSTTMMTSTDSTTIMASTDSTTTMMTTIEMTTTFPSVSTPEQHPPPDFYRPQPPLITNRQHEQQADQQQYPSFNIPETGECIDGPSLPIKCDPKRPWPACPPQSYCYATNSVDIGPYFCCPVWSTRGAAWRPSAPFYNYVPEMPEDWPDIVKLTANWPHSISIPNSFQRSEPIRNNNNNQQQSVSHEESSVETPTRRRIQGYIRRWLRRMVEGNNEN